MFLSHILQRISCWPDIVKRAETSGAVVLDAGCGLGQDLRYLAAVGCPTEQMWALDLISAFCDLGYELFRDGEKMKANFVAADLVGGGGGEGIERGGGCCYSGDVVSCVEVEGPGPGCEEYGWVVEDSDVDWYVLTSFSCPYCISILLTLKWAITSVRTVTDHYPSRPRSKPSVARSASATPKSSSIIHGPDWREMCDHIEVLSGTKWETEGRSFPWQDWGLKNLDMSWLGGNARAFEFICRRLSRGVV